MRFEPLACRLPGQQRGSALLLALVFMAVLARMALSGIDGALLGTTLALNYREHDRVFHTAESLLMALDASLLERIESDGLQVTVDTFSASEHVIVMPAQSVDDTGVSVLSYQGVMFEFPSQHDTPADGCRPVYQFVVQATGLRPATRVRLGLQRVVCCDDDVACEAGDFTSMHRRWLHPD